ncbi:MAG: hypothetical protein ACOC5B_00855 [Myxococcota bacterium]
MRMVRGEDARMVDLGRRRALLFARLMEQAAKRTGRPAPITRIAVRLLMRRSDIRSEHAMRTFGYAPRTDLATGMAACRRYLAQLGLAAP